MANQKQRRIPKRRKWRIPVLLLALVLVGVVVAIFCWPSASYDLAKVHPQLRALELPYRSVTTSYYLDGGSIGIRITDKRGTKLELALPVGSANPQPYPELFIGATHSSKPGAVKVEFTEDTRNMLIAIIEEYDPDDDSFLLSRLRGWPKDHAKFWWNMLARDVRRLLGVRPVSPP